MWFRKRCSLIISVYRSVASALSGFRSAMRSCCAFDKHKMKKTASLMVSFCKQISGSVNTTVLVNIYQKKRYEVRFLKFSLKK